MTPTPDKEFYKLERTNILLPARKCKAFLARSGIQNYLAGELGFEAEPKRILSIYRPQEELFSPETMRSFENVPVTLNHPEKFTEDEATLVDIVGRVVNVHQEGDLLVGDIYIDDQRALDFLESGKNELSIGYTFTLETQEGTTTDAQAFEAIQKNLRGNHVALVEKGRCGCRCRLEPLTLEDAQPNILDKNDLIIQILSDIQNLLTKKEIQKRAMGDTLAHPLLNAAVSSSVQKNLNGRDLFLSRTLNNYK